VRRRPAYHRPSSWPAGDDEPARHLTPLNYASGTSLHARAAMRGRPRSLALTKSVATSRRSLRAFESPSYHVLPTAGVASFDATSAAAPIVVSVLPTHKVD